MNRIILGIETSCDDTSIAIMKNGKLLSNVTFTSNNINKKYGGIVPELSARYHCKHIDHVFKQCVKKTKIKISDITHIAYTFEPGLIGSLHIGKIFANQIAILLGLEPIKINHNIAHIFSYFIDHSFKKKFFPFLSLVVSGGNTFIALVLNFDNIKILNQTIDDAIGEVLDKIGRALELPYPGGKSIDKIFTYKKIINLFKHLSANNKFSFAGLKTKILNIINQKRYSKSTIASSALKWIIDDLKIKLLHYLSKYPLVKNVVIGGGVSANRQLRKELQKLKDVKCFFPTETFTNDNGAMIAKLADLKITNHKIGKWFVKK